MSISNTQRSAGPFSGDGVTVALPFAFKVFEAADLVVERISAAGVRSVLTLGSHYTVVLNADQNVSPGGVVTLATALEVGASASVTSAVAATQPLQIRNGGPFLPSAIEDALDRVTVLVQQFAQTGSSQALRVPEIDGVDLLPAAADRALRVLAFDADGKPIAIVGVEEGSAAALQLDLASSASGKGAELVGFAADSASAAPRTVSDKLRDFVNLKDFGAAGNGDADDTGEIVAAIAAVAPGGRLYIPPGTYRTTSRITVDKPITIEGDGYGSVLQSDVAGTHIVLLVESPTFAAINGVRLANFRIDGNGRGQLDAGILTVNNAVGFVLDRLWIENATRSSGSSGVNGISFSAGSSGGAGPAGVVSNCYIRNTSKAGINWTSESVAALMVGNVIRDISGNGTAPGIQINGGADCKIIGNHITNTQGPGIYASSDGSGNPARHLVIVGNTVEACGVSSTTQGDGILLLEAGAVGRGVISSNIVVDCGINANGGSGINVQGHDNMVISGNLCRNNRYDGIRVQNCNHVNVVGNRLTGNNLAGVSFAGGLHVLGTCTHLQATGNHCSDDKTTKTQSYGIILASDAVLSNATISGNQLEGNAAGPILANIIGRSMRLSFIAERRTTDGSAQTAAYFGLPDDCSAVVTAKAVGKKEDGSARAIYTREALIYRDGGNATIQSSVSTIGSDIESDAAWGGLGLAVSSTLAVVQVTGVGATTVDWRIAVDVQTV